MQLIRNNAELTLLAYLISTIIIMFAIAGVIYLLGAIIMGWAWLTFSICIAISGTMIALTCMIVVCILNRKERR